MRRAFISFILLVFIAWLMPLGIFIKPSLEKIACDGQRAICLCHVAPIKTQHKAMEGISLRANADQHNETTPSLGAASSNYLSVSQLQRKPNLILIRLFHNESLAYQNPYLASLEHVPKF